MVWPRRTHDFPSEVTRQIELYLQTSPDATNYLQLVPKVQVLMLNFLTSFHQSIAIFSLILSPWVLLYYFRSRDHGRDWEGMKEGITHQLISS